MKTGYRVYRVYRVVYFLKIRYRVYRVARVYRVWVSMKTGYRVTGISVMSGLCELRTRVPTPLFFKTRGELISPGEAVLNNGGFVE